MRLDHMRETALYRIGGAQQTQHRLLLARPEILLRLLGGRHGSTYLAPERRASN
jgi:hypothetical protein